MALPPTAWSVRRAGPADAGAAADVWLHSRHAAVAVIPAPVHTDDEVRDWFASVVVPSREVWLAEAERQTERRTEGRGMPE